MSETKATQCTYQRVLFRIGRNVSERVRCRNKTVNESGRCHLHTRNSAERITG